jgi:hypothetical protein
MAGLSPRRCLDVLSNEDLYGILGSLPGAKVGGSKPERLERSVDHFGRMVFREIPAEAPPGELYFRYLTELAARDREVLLAPTPATAASLSAAAATSSCGTTRARRASTTCRRATRSSSSATSGTRPCASRASWSSRPPSAPRPPTPPPGSRSSPGPTRTWRTRERADVQPGGVQHHGGAGPDGAGGEDAVVFVGPSRAAMDGTGPWAHLSGCNERW